MDRSECGVRHKWDHVETERRREAFNAWVRTQANKAGFRLMPPAVQGIVHGMLRVAFYAGSNWQRRHGSITAAPPPPAEFDEWHDTKWPEPKQADPYHWRVEWKREKAKRREVWDAATGLAALSQRPVVPDDFHDTLYAAKIILILDTSDDAGGEVPLIVGATTGPENNLTILCHAEQNGTPIKLCVAPAPDGATNGQE